MHAERSASGQRGRVDPEALARVWLACAVHERAARRHLQREMWLPE